jgi:putative hydrolase of the HAD superfamily
MITIHNILDCSKLLDDVKGVVFDLDDTLYSEKDYVRSGYRAIARLFPQIDNVEQKLWTAFEHRTAAIDEVLVSEGLYTPENKMAALNTYRSHEPEITLYPQVRELLLHLKRKYTLGLITDGRPDGQRKKIKALNIENLFDAIIITDELGGIECRKPNEIAFRAMQQSFGIPFEQMVYIGDNIIKDFIAPERLGMKSIYFKNLDSLYVR